MNLKEKICISQIHLVFLDSGRDWVKREYKKNPQIFYGNIYNMHMEQFRTRCGVDICYFMASYHLLNSFSSIRKIISPYVQILFLYLFLFPFGPPIKTR